MRIQNLLTLIAALACCAGASLADDDRSDREFDAEPGGTLVLDMESGGSAVIEGWDENRIRIVWSDRVNEPEDWDVEFETDGDELRMVTELANRDIHTSSLQAEIWVPGRYDIEFESVGGSLHVTGVEGRFSGRTAGGSLELHDVHADVDLRTGGGRIEVTDSRVDGRMKTGGGAVLVKNVIGDLRATSGGGNVQYINVRNTDDEILMPSGLTGDGLGEKTVMISTAGGRISVKEAPEGAVVSTGGGNVRVRGADRFADANTGGGDIEIELESGWVSASTGAGDIEVTIDRDDAGDVGYELSSGYGDITLVLPGDFGMDLDVDLRYTRGSSRNFGVESDFDVEIEHSGEWERRRGSDNWIKHVYGKGEVNGGGRKVRIVTTNGNVYVRKR